MSKVFGFVGGVLGGLLSLLIVNGVAFGTDMVLSAILIGGLVLGSANSILLVFFDNMKADTRKLVLLNGLALAVTYAVAGLMMCLMDGRGFFFSGNRMPEAAIAVLTFFFTGASVGFGYRLGFTRLAIIRQRT